MRTSRAHRMNLKLNPTDAVLSRDLCLGRVSRAKRICHELSDDAISRRTAIEPRLHGAGRTDDDVVLASGRLAVMLAGHAVDAAVEDSDLEIRLGAEPDPEGFALVHGDEGAAFGDDVGRKLVFEGGGGIDLAETPRWGKVGGRAVVWHADGTVEYDSQGLWEVVLVDGHVLEALCAWKLG